MQFVNYVEVRPKQSEWQTYLVKLKRRSSMNKYNNNLWSVGYEFDRRICGSRQQLVQDYRSDFSQLGCHNGERVGKTTITSVSHWSDFQNQFKTSHLLWLQRKLWSYDESTVANLWTTDRNPQNKSCLLSAAACLLHCKTYRSCGLKYNCCIHYDFYNLLHPRKVGVLMVTWPADPRAFSSPSKYDKRPWGRGWVYPSDGASNIVRCCRVCPFPLLTGRIWDKWFAHAPATGKTQICGKFREDWLSGVGVLGLTNFASVLSIID